jgi:uncharacterized protein YdhG (YjbR/CyaY superfamily)
VGISKLTWKSIVKEARGLHPKPTPSGVEEFKRELAGCKFAKGSVPFSLGKPRPLRLIGIIVKFGVNEVKGKSAYKKGKKDDNCTV